MNKGETKTRKKIRVPDGDCTMLLVSSVRDCVADAVPVDSHNLNLDHHGVSSSSVVRASH